MRDIDSQITGIESPILLDPGARDYFADAWRARYLIEERAERSLPPDWVSLAVNSMAARSQNQLHIHIDCLRADVHQSLAQHAASIGPAWAASCWRAESAHNRSASDAPTTTTALRVPGWRRRASSRVSPQPRALHVPVMVESDESLAKVEGTTETIRRGLEVAGRGAVVAKAAARGHDYRFDMPTIGPETIEIATAGGATVVAVEAERVLVLDKEACLRIANGAGMALVGVE